jgi:hypothetical protein
MKRLAKNPISLLLVLLLMGMFAGACGSDSEPEKSSSALGTECEKHYGSGGCCLELAGDVQAAKDACATAKKSIEDSLTKGADKAQTEAACKLLNDQALQQGKCTGEDPCEVACKALYACGMEDDGYGTKNCPNFDGSQETAFVGDKSTGCIAWCKEDATVKSTVDSMDCSIAVMSLKADQDFADACGGQ